MLTKIDNICEEALNAHGGRKTLEGIKTKRFSDDIYLLTPPVGTAKVSTGNTEARPKRTPILPSTRKVYLFNSGNVVKLRIETL